MADHSQHLALPFPNITAQHILNCSYHSWHPHYRNKTPKARLIPLSQPFIDYLRADGIVLPPDSPRNNSNADDDSGYSDASDEDEDEDPSNAWPEVHSKVKETIAELGGKVLPKLNWSAPKDATWMSSTNDMECRTPNEVYLLLKSSDFITHDLEQAFDGCADLTPTSPAPNIPYHLVLRKAFNLNPSVEFRVFVRRRRIIAISQREMNYFEFLFDLRKLFRAKINQFFEDTLETQFPDENFVFDVYIPPPHERVWLIDINPWAPRTDPLLFSWLELLTMDVPGDEEDGNDSPAEGEEVDEIIFTPEFRLVQRDDPEAYQFAATKYSAHKLPKDVIDASTNAGGIKDMMEEWKKVMERQNAGDSDESEDGVEEGARAAANATHESGS